MERLLEYEIFAAVLGESVNSDHLNKISVHNGKGHGSYSDCDEFSISLSDFYLATDLSKLIRITDGIKKRWEENNIDFRIYLYLNDLKIIGGHIFKYRILLLLLHCLQLAIYLLLKSLLCLELVTQK